MWEAIHAAAPQAEYTGIALEYGTEPITEVLDALRGDHWLAQHPEAPPCSPPRSKPACCAPSTPTPTLEGQIVSQARQALFQAADGLQ
jgi:hypothetical protein